MRLTFHPGASWVAGAGILHVSAAPIGRDELSARWSMLESRRLVGPDLEMEEDSGGLMTASGSVSRGVPIGVIREVLSAPPRRLRGRALLGLLEQHRLRARTYDESFGHYERHARRRGWVYQVEGDSVTPVHALGIGRFSRLLVLNTDEDAKAPIVFAGRDKAFGRTLLAAFGLPVAPGELARSVRDAVGAARRLGYPVVLKGPSSGDSTEVLSEIRDDKSCRSGARELLRRNAVLVVERLVRGPQYRLQFINGVLHAVLRCNAMSVSGDGDASLLDILRRTYPAYLEVLRAHRSRQRVLINLTWHLGVRSMRDLAKVRPARGQEVPITAATGHGVMTPCPRSAIRQDDRRALERMLGELGAPSAAVDLVLSRAGAKLSEGGAIFEINVPCGFSYLRDAARTAGRELDGVVARTPGFARSGGRVPVWLVAEDAVARDHVRRVKAWFRARQPRGRRIDVGPDSRWMPLLSDRSATAFLVSTTTAAIEELGLPVNLRPRCVHGGRPEAFRRAHPRLCAAIVNAGGALRSVQAVTGR